MKRKHYYLPGMIMLLGTTLLGTALARDLTDQQRTVVCKLRDVVEEAGRDGFELAFWPVIGKGPARVSAPLTLRLDPSIEYLFVGYCDENCADVELRVKTMSGEVLEFDEDLVSVVSFEPPFEDDYELSLRMTDCSAEDGCVFGMGILAPRGVKVPHSSNLPRELAQFQLCD